MSELSLSLIDFRNGVFFGILLSVTAGGVAWMIQLGFKTWNNLIGGR